MKDGILPIGSVITAEGQELMICAYLNKDAVIENDHFDYACCLYPSGMSDKAILVKKSQITRINFIGYQNGKFLAYKKQLENKNE